MEGAYLLDSELKIYSKADRNIALNQLLEKLGVAGSVDIKISCGSSIDKINKNVFIFNNLLRKLSSVSLMGNETDAYYKYLIIHNRKNNTVGLLYNTHFYKELKQSKDPTILIPVYNLEVECMFKINDFWEAIRMIECSSIDIGLDEILKSMYFEMYDANKK